MGKMPSRVLLAGGPDLEEEELEGFSLMVSEEDVVTPDTLVYTFDHSRSRGLGSTNHRSNEEGAAPSAAAPPASARGAAAIDTKRPALAEWNHPRAVTILQSPNGSNID